MEKCNQCQRYKHLRRLSLDVRDEKNIWRYHCDDCKKDVEIIKDFGDYKKGSGRHKIRANNQQKQESRVGLATRGSANISSADTRASNSGRVLEKSKAEGSNPSLSIIEKIRMYWYLFTIRFFPAGEFR